MKTKAVRLYGKNDLRLDDVILPEISDDEVRNIMNRDISHCTVQNINGKPQLVSDSSYGGLYWTCNPENVYSMYN